MITETELLLDLFRVCNEVGCGSITDRDDIKLSTVGAAVTHISGLAVPRLDVDANKCS